MNKLHESVINKIKKVVKILTVQAMMLRIPPPMPTPLLPMLPHYPVPLPLHKTCWRNMWMSTSKRLFNLKEMDKRVNDCLADWCRVEQQSKEFIAR